MDGSVESLYDDYLSLRDVLKDDPSGLVSLERIFPKALLLASASFLEVTTTHAVSMLFSVTDAPELQLFIERKALKRQFHTLFDWDRQKANGFFAMFGDACRDRYKKEYQADANLSESADSFLEIGSLRNQLVHQNYADFNLSKTAEEIAALHARAVAFPGMLKEIITRNN